MVVATAIMAGAFALFAGKTSAGVIPKSNASTFYDNVPGLSLAPSTLSLSKNTKGNGHGIFANTKLDSNSGVHAMRVMTPGGPLHEFGMGVGSNKLDVGFAVDEMKGECIVIGGTTFRASNEIAANLVVSTGKDGKLNWVFNTNIAVSENLGVSARKDNEGYAVGADADVNGVMPSASLTVTEKGTQVDTNIWSQKMGPDGKVRVAGIWNDIGGENTVKIQLRISL